MKTLVIHPEDHTTDFLSVIYADQDWTVIRSNVYKSYLRKQIKEHDRIVMLGHGTEKGLLGFGRLVINSDYVDLLREKTCVFIWCNADVFVEKYDLCGFYTGMIISEYEEAVMYGVPTNSHWIRESNEDFANAIRDGINEDDMSDMVKLLYEGNSAVVEFNRANIHHRPSKSVSM